MDDDCKDFSTGDLIRAVENTIRQMHDIMHPEASHYVPDSAQAQEAVALLHQMLDDCPEPNLETAHLMPETFTFDPPGHGTSHQRALTTENPETASLVSVTATTGDSYATRQQQPNASCPTSTEAITEADAELNEDQPNASPTSGAEVCHGGGAVHQLSIAPAGHRELEAQGVAPDAKTNAHLIAVPGVLSCTVDGAQQLLADRSIQTLVDCSTQTSPGQSTSHPVTSTAESLIPLPAMSWQARTPRSSCDSVDGRLENLSAEDSHSCSISPDAESATCPALRSQVQTDFPVVTDSPLPHSDPSRLVQPEPSAARTNDGPDGRGELHPERLAASATGRAATTSVGEQKKGTSPPGDPCDPLTRTALRDMKACGAVPGTALDLSGSQHITGHGTVELKVQLIASGASLAVQLPRDVRPSSRPESYLMDTSEPPALLQRTQRRPGPQLDLSNHDAMSGALLSLLGTQPEALSAGYAPSTALARALLEASRSPERV